MPGRLRAVPGTPPRAVLYLRQSVARDESISLELQEAAGREYCLRSGYTVVRVESDPGISGRTWKRPAVLRVMTMVEAGEADVVVLWKWSRLSRSRRDWAIAVDKVESVGGRIESATETVDVSTATGRLARGMLAEFAAFESDRMGEVWKEVHASRLAAGKAPTGLPKYGYAWNREKQIHEVDPITGPILAQAYERFAAGESTYSLIKWLNSAGIKTIRGGMWSDNALRRVMDTGFAAGFIPWKGQRHPGNHEPLISEDLFQKYLDARAGRRLVAPRAARSTYLLTGLLKCGRCGGPMHGSSDKNNPRKTDYRCGVNKTRGPDACPGNYVQVRVVHEKVKEWLESVASEVEESSTVAESASIRKLSAEAETRRLASELNRLDKAMQRLTVQVAEGLVAESAYGSAREELEDKYGVVQERMEAQARLARLSGVHRGPLARRLLDEWEELPLEVRRNVLKQLLQHVRATSNGRKFELGTEGAQSRAVVEVLPMGSDEYVWL